MDGENGGTPILIAAASPSHGDGVRAPIAVRQTMILLQPIAGTSLAPSCGSINQVGGALPQRIPLRIVEERTKQLRRFFYTGREVTVHLGAPASDRDELSWLEEQIMSLLNRMQDDGASADDHVDLLLNSTDSTLNPVYVSFSTAPLYVKLSHSKESRGSGRNYCDKLSPASTYSHNNKGIITIQNGDDTLCLARALVVARAICDVKREPGCAWA
uniref:Uncharacterized protein n=1 Tax=Timema douglasi TaxID=61478 RepID=A0A7R8ZD79_TIMDO|nr:unnamed protein product [Timema douglasi]